MLSHNDIIGDGVSHSNTKFLGAMPFLAVLQAAEVRPDFPQPSWAVASKPFLVPDDDAKACSLSRYDARYTVSS